MQNTNTFLTKAKFSKMVQAAVLNKRLSYIDAVLDTCENNNVDPRDAKKFLSKPIKNKIEQEAKKLNFIPKTDQLPV